MGKSVADVPPKPIAGSAWRIVLPCGKPQTRIVLHARGMLSMYDVDYVVAETGRIGSVTQPQWERWAKKAVNVDDTERSLPFRKRVMTMDEELSTLREAVADAISLCRRANPDPRAVADLLKVALVSGRLPNLT